MTERERLQPRTGRRRLGAATGVLLVAGTVVSSASYTDEATLGLAGAGIGFPHTFAIGVVAADGTAEPADAEAGVEWLVEGAGTLVPGRSVSTVVQVFNNTPTLDADTVLEVVARGGDGAVAEAIPNITPHLRLSAQDQDGVVLFSDVPWEQARGSVGRLVARGSGSLAAGEPYTAGPAGSERQITLTIDYLDEPGVEALNGGQAALSLRIDATSVTP